MYNNVNYKIQGDQISTDLEGQLQQTNDLIFLEPHPAMCHFQYCKQFKKLYGWHYIKSAWWPYHYCHHALLHFMHNSTYALPLMLIHTLDGFRIAADPVCCHCSTPHIKLLDEPPPGGCWISGNPPVHQDPPAIVRWILAFNFITFWVCHKQAWTQRLPLHFLHCLCHCLWCQWSNCN